MRRIPVLLWLAVVSASSLPGFAQGTGQASSKLLGAANAGGDGALPPGPPLPGTGIPIPLGVPKGKDGISGLGGVASGLKAGSSAGGRLPANTWQLGKPKQR